MKMFFLGLFSLTTTFICPSVNANAFTSQDIVHQKSFETVQGFSSGFWDGMLFIQQSKTMPAGESNVAPYTRVIVGPGYNNMTAFLVDSVETFSKPFGNGAEYSVSIYKLKGGTTLTLTALPANGGQKISAVVTEGTLRRNMAAFSGHEIDQIKPKLSSDIAYSQETSLEPAFYGKNVDKLKMSEIVSNILNDLNSFADELKQEASDLAKDPTIRDLAHEVK